MKGVNDLGFGASLLYVCLYHTTERSVANGVLVCFYCLGLGAGYSLSTTWKAAGECVICERQSTLSLFTLLWYSPSNLELRPRTAP
jgi:hypothetical protein